MSNMASSLREVVPTIRAHESASYGTEDTEGPHAFTVAKKVLSTLELSRKQVSVQQAGLEKGQLGEGDECSTMQASTQTIINQHTLN